MIKRLIFLSLVCCFYSTMVQSLPTNKGKYNQLRQSLDSIPMDSTTFGQRYGTLLDEIFLDNYQVINALSVQNDSLKKSSSSLETNYLTMVPKLTFYRYIIYGLAALALIFLVFVLLFLIKSSKLTRSLKQKNIEQGKFNSEMEKITANLSNEAEQYKSAVEIFEKDKNQLLAQIQLKTKENEQLKQEYEEKNNAFTALQKSAEEFKMQQESINELHRQEQGNLQQYIQKIDELTNQINDLKNNHNLTLQQIEALKNELSIITQQKEQLSNEIKQLQQEYDALKQLADEATETKNRVDVELKKFVEELQTMLPLPKS